MFWLKDGAVLLGCNRRSNRLLNVRTIVREERHGMYMPPTLYEGRHAPKLSNYTQTFFSGDAVQRFVRFIPV